MRIALLTDGIYPYVMGGMQRHSYYLAKYLSRKKVHVTLFHFNQSDFDIDKLEMFSEEEKAYIESVVVPFPKGDRFPGHYIRSSYKHSGLIYDLIKDRVNEFDFIYSKGFSAWRLIEEKKKDPAKFPPVGVKFHGYEMFQKASKLIIILHQQMLKGPVKWISLHADHVFSYGGKITALIRQLGVDRDRIIEIPAGIEPNWLTEQVSPVSAKINFTFLGRYERRKGVEELNKVLRSLISEQIDFRFNFIGPFNDNEKVMSDRIFYHGVINDNAELKKRLDATDVLVCPSLSEGMPNVILEAMARGCAVIATDVGAVSLMVDAENGMLISPGNIPQLNEAMKRIITLPAGLLDMMKQKSLEKIRNNFVYDRIIDRFIDRIKAIKAQDNDN
jgi:glycosyltransferase involved in cell wall biosynthesis